jgi:hypothetical protein
MIKRSTTVRIRHSTNLTYCPWKSVNRNSLLQHAHGMCPPTHTKLPWFRVLHLRRVQYLSHCLSGLIRKEIDLLPLLNGPTFSPFVRKGNSKSFVRNIIVQAYGVTFLSTNFSYRSQVALLNHLTIIQFLKYTSQPKENYFQCEPM